MVNIQLKYPIKTLDPINESSKIYNGNLSFMESFAKKFMSTALSLGLLSMTPTINSGIGTNLLETASSLKNILNQHHMGYNKGTSLLSNANYYSFLTGADKMDARRQLIKGKINRLGYQKHQPVSDISNEEQYESIAHIEHNYNSKRIKAVVKKIGYIPHVIELDDEEV